MNISEQEFQIFARQLILKEFDEKTFDYIQKQHVFIIGIGGIGCPAAQYLLSTGIKNLTLIDNDRIHITNLNRQTLYSINNLGEKKVDVANKILKGINPKCKIKTISKKIDETNIKKYLSNPSIVIDTTDNWYSMNVINKFCVEQSIPLISASVVGFDGQVILFNNTTKNHLCLNCIYPNNDEPDLPRCDTVGILGIAAGLTGLIAAQTTINFFTKNNLTTNVLIMINSKSMKITHIKVKNNSNCINNSKKS